MLLRKRQIAVVGRREHDLAWIQPQHPRHVPIRLPGRLVSPGRIRTDDHGPGQFRPQRHPQQQGEVCVRQRSDDHVSAEFAQAGDAVLPRIQPLLCRIEVAELAVVEVGRIQAELRKGRVEVLQVQPVQRHKLPAPIADRLH